MSTTITGMKEIDSKLRHLSGRAARTIARKAVNAGSAELVKGIKADTPKGPTRKNETHRPGALKRSVGKRFKKGRKSGLYEGKAGYNVGKKRSNRNFAPHAGPAAVGGKINRRPLRTIQRSYARNAQFARRIMLAKLAVEIRHETN